MDDHPFRIGPQLSPVDVDVGAGCGSSLLRLVSQKAPIKVPRNYVYFKASEGI